MTIIECHAFLDVEDALREARADIGITCLPTSDEFEVWEVMRDEYIALLPPDTEVNTQLTWDFLNNYFPVMIPCTPCGRVLHNHLKVVAPSLKTTTDIQEDSTIVSMVRQGLRAAILPRLAAVPIPQQIQVYSLPIPLDRVIGIAILTNGLHVPAVFKFLEMLKKFDFLTLAQSTY